MKGEGKDRLQGALQKEEIERNMMGWSEKGIGTQKETKKEENKRIDKEKNRFPGLLPSRI